MESIKVKSLAIAFILLVTVSSGRAQTWNETFRQKQTQKKYLLEQLAALKLYADYLGKGYKIVHTGLQTVKDISKGEFNLHNTFINSLKAVRPLIRNNSKVSGIIVFQLEISKALNGVKGFEQLSGSNHEYIQSVRNAVMDECSKDLEELYLIITSGKVEMTDDERLRRLDYVYEAMRDKARFIQRFTNDIQLLIRQKKQETESINELKNSYGISN